MKVLTENWRKLWRAASMHVATVAVLFGTLPSDSQAAILGALGIEPSRVPLALGLAFMAARVLRQPSVN